jgi:hypothetical protein
MFYEYNGDTGLGLRERTQARVRADLVRNNPDWVAWSKDKGQYRVNRQYIIADELKSAR